MFHRFVLAMLLTAPGCLFAATPVNINQANAATIAKSLDGIGQTRAQAIVAWREAHGPFKSASQLSRVKGIGKTTLERNRGAILLADVPPTSSMPSPRRPRSVTKE